MNILSSLYIGGHGKRSDTPRIDLSSLDAPQDKEYTNVNKEVFVSLMKIFNVNLLIIFFIFLNWIIR